MPNIGPMELVVVLIIALLVVGPKRLPDVGKSLGRGVKEFKDSVAGIVDTDRDDESRNTVEAEQTKEATETEKPEEQKLSEDS